MNYIDLFAGAGGLSEGFIKTGYEAIAHVEMNHDAANTLRTRLSYYYLKKNKKINLYYKYLRKEITREDLYKEIPAEVLNTVIEKEITIKTLPSIFKTIDDILVGKNVDIIVGGPPCQAYSLVGRPKQQKIKEDQKNGREIDDDRKYLYKLYFEFLKYYEPKLFVYENVPGLLNLDDGKYWKDIKKIFRELGYEVNYRQLNSKDFGVPQERKRIILIGTIGSTKFVFPDFSTKKNNCTLKELLDDLPSIQAGEELNEYNDNKPHSYTMKHFRSKDDVLTWHLARRHNDRDREIYRIAIKKWIENNQQKRLHYYELPKELITHKNTKDFTDRFKIIPPNLYHSHTVLAHIAKDGHYYIHYDLKQARSLTVREAARLQSFPDNFYFEGSRTAAYTQIGNAVPPMMAEGIAKEIKKQLRIKGGKNVG
ncbi:MAG TPA: DNA cytosine methyltransferase [Gallicola sp.]|nr:DNA cytosine methyltransferase [Gallicola sp.]